MMASVRAERKPPCEPWRLPCALAGNRRGQPARTPMPGLSLEHRADLCRRLNALVLARVRVPGTRKLLLTTTDAAVFKALALDFYNGATGRCDPGYRAIAK